ncbi:MAG: winged helix-turn-helix domain-containing protein [Thermoanaerobaculia bacterium]
MKFRFGEYELTPASYELTRSGTPLHVEPRVFEVLAFLVANRDRVVPKEELLDKLWPDQFVSESALTRTIRDARRALGDTGSKGGWIRTVHGRGFRFSPDARTTGDASPLPRRPERPGIVVLPLDDLSGDPSQAFFTDGMTEMLTSELAAIRSLKVISRTSAMRYRGARKPVPEIAAELGVDYVVEGSVQRAGDRIRITAQLIQARDDEHLWAESYDRDLTDLFAIQSDVALRIADALRATLSPVERRRLDRQPTGSFQAYQLYLQGRFSHSRYSEESLRRATDYFREAIAVDPDFALAYTGLARAYAELGNEGYPAEPPVVLFERAREAIATALEIDDGLGEAHGLSALLRFSCNFDWKGAEQEFERALELAPGSADIYDHYGWLCQFQGRWNDALRLLTRAREIDPLSHSTDLAATLLRAGRIQESYELSRSIVVFDPTLVRGHSGLGWALLLLGRPEEGLRAIEKAVEISRGGTLFLGQLGLAYAKTGRIPDARRVLRELLALRARRYVSPYHVAYVHAELDPDEAIVWLERAYDDRSPGIAGIGTSFLFADLRDHPGFIALLRRMHLA